MVSKFAFERFAILTPLLKPKDVLDNENEFDEVLESGESTTEEVFNTLDQTASRTEEWVAKNQKLILGIVGVIALATIFAVVTWLIWRDFWLLI